jgi:hypothetical protein
MKIQILLLCGIVLWSGCVSISSGERTVQEGPATETLGEQLNNLKADYDRGRISEQEYNRRRENLLGR